MRNQIVDIWTNKSKLAFFISLILTVILSVFTMHFEACEFSKSWKFHHVLPNSFVFGFTAAILLVFVAQCESLDEISDYTTKKAIEKSFYSSIKSFVAIIVAFTAVMSSISGDDTNMELIQKISDIKNGVPSIDHVNKDSIQNDQKNENKTLPKDSCHCEKTLSNSLEFNPQIIIQNPMPTDRNRYDRKFVTHHQKKLKTGRKSCPSLDHNK